MNTEFVVYLPLQSDPMLPDAAKEINEWLQRNPKYYLVQVLIGNSPWAIAVFQIRRVADLRDELGVSLLPDEDSE